MEQTNKDRTSKCDIIIGFARFQLIIFMYCRAQHSLRPARGSEEREGSGAELGLHRSSRTPCDFVHRQVSHQGNLLKYTLRYQNLTCYAIFF